MLPAAEEALFGTLLPGQSAAAVTAAHHWRGERPALNLALNTVSDLEPVEVRINHGRWIVECPFGDGGAQFASRLDQRFLCSECLNNAQGWRAVLWPENAAEIAAALVVRPESLRNWVPGESVEDLVLENLEGKAS